MGLLIVKKYRTKLFAKAADHTYVECGSGARAWSCWGGKVGGTAFNAGEASTKRADAIAGPDERAGITTYLVNGVCHQAANRIVLPAGIQVSNARGYFLSRSIFGAYGKPSTFNHFKSIHGDFAECLEGSKESVVFSRISVQQMTAQDRALLKNISRSHENFRDSRRFDDPLATLDWMKANVRLFERETVFQFRGRLGRKTIAGLKAAKLNVEVDHYRISSAFLSNQSNAADFVIAFNEMTSRFQDSCAEALSGDQYRIMFKTAPSERLVLADPSAVDVAFGIGTAAKVYGDA